jgi:hypothetical protein
MNTQHTYLINTGILFYALNTNRKNNGLMEIDNPLIASKLGILFALKTNGYVNFRDQSIQLNNEQLIALQEILDQHFNIEMTDEFRTLMLTKDNSVIDHHPSRLSSPLDNKGFFNKIRGFLKPKPKIQENLA